VRHCLAATVTSGGVPGMRRKESMATNAYCVKCKAKRDMRNESKITMKNGKPATQGTCPVCGTKMFKIGG
jgi:hypothetical protein